MPVKGAPLSSDDADGELMVSLNKGLPYEIESIRDRRTTVKMEYSDTLRNDIDSIKNDAPLSRTGCEMVIGHLARKKVQERFAGTKMAWPGAVSNLWGLVKNGSEMEERVRSDMELMLSAASSITVNRHSREEYKMCLIDKDYNQLSQKQSNYGLPAGRRIMIGVTMVVTDNEGMFGDRTVDQSRQVLEFVNNQIEMVHKPIENTISSFARMMYRADAAGELYESDCKDKLDASMSMSLDGTEFFAEKFFETQESLGNTDDQVLGPELEERFDV